MLPLGVPDGFPIRWRGRLAGITVGPLVPNELIVLLAPHHSSESLALDVSKILTHGQRADSIVEVIRFVFTPFNDLIEFFFVEIGLSLLAETESHNYNGM